VLLAVSASLSLRADRLGTALSAAAALAVALLLIGLLFRWAGPLPWAYACAGAGYAGFLFIRGAGIDPIAPLYGAGLLLSAELAYWSLERPIHGSLRERRAYLIVGACLAGGGIGGLILTFAEVSVHGGLGLEILGVAAAVAALSLIARLARAA
jgi:hypothetical protein